MDHSPWFMNGSVPKTVSWNTIWTEAVERFSSLTAFRSTSGEVSFSEMDRLAGGVARRISSLPGWKSGTTVALPSHDAAYPWNSIGIWLAGGVIVPFNQDACEKNSELKRAVEKVAGWCFAEDGTLIRNRNQFASGDGWHAIYFTSGSTGEPKAVVRGWGQALFEAGHYASMIAPEPGNACTMLVDPAFGASTKNFLGCLLSGAVQILGADVRKLPLGGHVLYGTPAHILSLSGSPVAGSAYSWISLTGEPCSQVAWQAVKSLALPEGRCLNALGGSEFGVALNMITDVSDFPDTPPPFIGTGLEGKSLSVRDGEGGLLPCGEPGLLTVISPWIAEGYLDLGNELPALKPFHGQGMNEHFLTGDVVVLSEDGFFRHLGRSGSMVKRHGRWLDTSRLRNALMSSGRGIRDFLLDVNNGSQQFRLLIEMTPTDPSSIDGIMFLITEEFGDTELMPGEVIFVREFPRNRNGKIDLAMLSSLRTTAGHGGMTIRVPVSRIERIAVSISDGDFSPKIFNGANHLRDLGLDSLELVELAELLGRASGTKVPMEALLCERTLEDLASSFRGIDYRGFSRFGNPDAGKRILWFGAGVGSLVNHFGGECEIWHWNCDRITEGDMGKKIDSISGMTRKFLSMAPSSEQPEILIVGGFSFGAMIAQEASMILSHMGVRPRRTILLDPPDLNGRHIRSAWRWSRWRPRILRSFLHSFPESIPGRFGAWLRRMDSLQLAGCIRERHRQMLRAFRPSVSVVETTLLTSREFHTSSFDVFGKCIKNLKVVALPAEYHHEVLDQHDSVKEWTAAISINLF